MRDFEKRMKILEFDAARRSRSNLSPHQRKALTDRAVLRGDQEALGELFRYRTPLTSDAKTKEQKQAALAAGLRADS